jgi:hypothetical protein
VVLIIIGVTHFNGSYLFDVLSFKKSSWTNPFKLIIFLPYTYELLWVIFNQLYWIELLFALHTI